MNVLRQIFVLVTNGFLYDFLFLYHSILKLWILMCQLGTEYNGQVGTRATQRKDDIYMSDYGILFHLSNCTNLSLYYNPLSIQSSAATCVPKNALCTNTR